MWTAAELEPASDIPFPSVTSVSGCLGLPVSLPRKDADRHVPLKRKEESQRDQRQLSQRWDGQVSLRFHGRTIRCNQA